MSPPAHQDRIAEEAWLVARIGAGDRAAFRDLYARYSPPLFALAIRMLGDARDAEEVLQDIFVKVWAHAHEYDANVSRPFTWAMVLARRTCIDALRKRQRARAGATEDTARAEHEDTEAPDPSAAAMASDDRSEVRGALDALPADQRRVLEQVLFAGKSQAEVAAEFNYPLGTVKSWVRRGLMTLKAGLNREQT